VLSPIDADQALAWYAKAQPALELAAKTNSKDMLATSQLVGCLRDRARLYRTLGRHAECFADYEMALRLRTDDRLLLLSAASAMADCPDPTLQGAQRAVILAKQAIQGGPETQMAWRVLGIAQYRLGNYSEAVTALNRAIELRGKASITHESLMLAMAHWKLNHYQEAAKWRTRASEWLKNNKPTEELTRLLAEIDELMIKKPPQKMPNGARPPTREQRTP